MYKLKRLIIMQLILLLVVFINTLLYYKFITIEFSEVQI